MKRAHFWTLADVRGLEAWDPDLEPDRHLTGYGHGFLELYSRLQHLGKEVSIGPDVPRRCGVVIVSLEELTEWHSGVLSWKAYRLSRAIAGHRLGVLSIRTDLPLEVQSPRFATLEVMPTITSVRDETLQKFLPLFPQRGLVPRRIERGQTIETIALKAYSYNVPEWLDKDFVDELASFGCQLRVDTELDRPNRWQDYAEVDVVLCVHPSTLLDTSSKPPTKLINAWSAGTIPLCGPHIGYLEQGTPGEDLLVGDDPQALLHQIRRLRQHPEIAAEVLSKVDIRRRQLSPEAIASEWWDAIQSTRRSSMGRVFSALFVAVAQHGTERLRHRHWLRQ